MGSASVMASYSPQIGETPEQLEIVLSREPEAGPVEPSLPRKMVAWGTILAGALSVVAFTWAVVVTRGTRRNPRWPESGMGGFG